MPRQDVQRMLSGMASWAFMLQCNSHILLSSQLQSMGDGVLLMRFMVNHNHYR